MRRRKEGLHMAQACAIPACLSAPGFSLDHQTPRHPLAPVFTPACLPCSPAGDQHGHIRVWDLTANACSCELVPEGGTGAGSWGAFAAPVAAI